MVESQGIVIDRHGHRVLYQDQELPLTPTEFRLLEVMIRQKGRAFTRFELMDAAIGEDAVVLERTIDVHIKSLRKKLGEAADLIETVRGVGYRFHEPRLVESVTSGRIGAGAGTGFAELALGVEQVGDELRADDPDVGGGLDAEPDLPAFDPDDRDADVVADHQFFHQLASQDQHGEDPLGLRPGAVLPLLPMSLGQGSAACPLESRPRHPRDSPIFRNILPGASHV